MSVDKKALRKSLRTNFNPGPRDYLNRAVLRARQAAHLPALAAGKTLDRPIFIIGAPRSGTSMLYAILRASAHLAHWPGEAHEVWEADHHPALRGWESNALTTADADPATTARIRREFFLVTGPNKRLIDKTPRNALRVPFIDAIFPDARYIFLQRDGRDNINSLINAWRTPRYRTYQLPEPHAVPGVDPKWWKFTLYPGWRDDARGPLEVVCAKQWKLSYDYALAALEEVPPERWLRVSYEDLVEAPEDEVGRIMSFLGLEYEAEVRAKAVAARSKPVNVVTPPERGKWRRENRAEIEAVASLIAPTMEALGYGD
ncbi:MAG: sulfotransferase [Actinomycetota bacterium]|nr:sulfotransferase [Actinomycetota bacterium]